MLGHFIRNPRHRAVAAVLFGALLIGGGLLLFFR